MDSFEHYTEAIVCRIADIMRDKYINHADLASRLGVDYAVVRRYFSGSRNFKIKTLFNIAGALEVGIEDLLPGKEKKNN